MITITNGLFTLVGGVVGSVATHFLQKSKDSLQKMKCYYIEDEVLAKVPIVGANESTYDNLYCKRFVLKNTTNKDLSNFKVCFQFDISAIITDANYKTKVGYKQIYKSRGYDNATIVSIKDFNRGDEIEFTFRIGNVSNNEYRITESGCIGFRIVCKDKRKNKKTKSKQSNQLLIENKK